MFEKIANASIIFMYSMILVGFVPELLPLWYEGMYRLIFMKVEV